MGSICKNIHVKLPIPYYNTIFLRNFVPHLKIKAKNVDHCKPYFNIFHVLQILFTEFSLYYTKDVIKSTLTKGRKENSLGFEEKSRFIYETNSSKQPIH